MTSVRSVQSSSNALQDSTRRGGARYRGSLVTRKSLTKVKSQVIKFVDIMSFFFSFGKG